MKSDLPDSEGRGRRQSQRISAIVGALTFLFVYLDQWRLSPSLEEGFRSYSGRKANYLSEYWSIVGAGILVAFGVGAVAGLLTYEGFRGLYHIGIAIREHRKGSEFWMRRIFALAGAFMLPWIVYATIWKDQPSVRDLVATSSEFAYALWEQRIFTILVGGLAVAGLGAIIGLILSEVFIRLNRAYQALLDETEEEASSEGGSDKDPN